eukprot:TRINITY_DN51840_c0_g1_i1.p1 TRINITY_DN51840_c0_g1~~TRINITY_DN51840_c0_g1_i1.p1  ORF type:complete len:331 (-),score=50.30 TRINITY_DN51840_c0_g1_i1:78-1007(-)
MQEPEMSFEQQMSEISRRFQLIKASKNGSITSGRSDYRQRLELGEQRLQAKLTPSEVSDVASHSLRVRMLKLKAAENDAAAPTRRDDESQKSPLIGATAGPQFHDAEVAMAATVEPKLLTPHSTNMASLAWPCSLDATGSHKSSRQLGVLGRKDCGTMPTSALLVACSDRAAAATRASIEHQHSHLIGGDNSDGNSVSFDNKSRKNDSGFITSGYDGRGICTAASGGRKHGVGDGQEFPLRSYVGRSELGGDIFGLVNRAEGHHPSVAAFDEFEERRRRNLLRRIRHESSARREQLQVIVPERNFLISH